MRFKNLDSVDLLLSNIFAISDVLLPASITLFVSSVIYVPCLPMLTFGTVTDVNRR